MVHAGALRPVAGWHLTPAELDLDEVVDRIIRDHVTTPTAAGHVAGLADHQQAPPTSWCSTTASARRRCSTMRGGCLSALYEYGDKRTNWLVCRVEEVATDDDVPRFRMLDDPDEVPVYGTSLAMVLDAALDSGGDFAHLETGRLSELDELERARHDK